MQSRLIIDGNAVYEIDEDCMEYQKERRRESESAVRGSCTVRYQDSKGTKPRRSR